MSIFNQKEEVRLVSQNSSSLKLGKNISALRKKSGMTQEELAERLGVSAQAVSKWENETSCPDISLLPEIAGIFGVTVDELMCLEADRISQLLPAANKNVKKKLHIIVTQPNQKESVNVRLPMSIVNVGLNIGEKFGLPSEVSQAIEQAVSNNSIGEIVTVNGDHGETVRVTIE